jgi:hypothetical protein
MKSFQLHSICGQSLYGPAQNLVFGTASIVMLYLLLLLANLSFYFVPIYFIVSRILKVAVPLLQELHAKIFEA